MAEVEQLGRLTFLTSDIGAGIGDNYVFRVAFDALPPGVAYSGVTTNVRTGTVGDPFAVFNTSDTNTTPVFYGTGAGEMGPRDGVSAAAPFTDPNSFVVQVTDTQGDAAAGLSVRRIWTVQTTTTEDGLIEVQATILGTTGNQGQYGVAARCSTTSTGDLNGFFLGWSPGFSNPALGHVTLTRTAAGVDTILASIQHGPGVLNLKVGRQTVHTPPSGGVTVPDVIHTHVVGMIGSVVVFDGHDDSATLPTVPLYAGMFSLAVTNLDNGDGTPGTELYFQKKMDDFSLKLNGTLVASDDFNRAGSDVSVSHGPTDPTFGRDHLTSPSQDLLGNTSVGSKTWLYLSPAAEAHGWQVYDGGAMAYLGQNLAVIDLGLDPSLAGRLRNNTVQFA